MNRLPIGIFDSGVGGLTVYRALHNRLPNEHFIYLGDTARVPYGTKSLATVERYAIENSQFLASRGIKMLVVACNTASALRIAKDPRKDRPRCRRRDRPRRAKSGRDNKNQGTARGSALSRPRRPLPAMRILRRSGGRPETAEVFQAGCPLFVPLAEENWGNEPETASIAAKYLAKMNEFRPDALVLGCTHYPILQDVIQQTVGENVKLIDSGEATADEVEKLLADKEPGESRCRDRQT